MDSVSSQENLCKEPKNIHVLELVKDDMELLHQITVENLKAAGVQVPSLKRRESRAKSRTPVQSTATNSSIQMLVEVSVKTHNVNIEIPKFLPILCGYISKHLSEQGLFRIAGSTARTNSLIGNLDLETQIDASVSVFDVCSALKQLIRKMEVPIIPPNLHSLFLRCLEFPMPQRTETILLCVFLLPKIHLHILFYLMEFLHEVARHSEKNKMDAKNLAIVFAPNIMPLTSIPTKKSGKDSDDSSCGDLINSHVEIVKILIEAGDRLGIVSSSMAADLVAAICRNSEDELDDDCDMRKRKRSSSLNRALNSAAGVLEFICKKRSRKNVQTPSSIVAQGYCTPGDMCTPIIRPLSRKRTNDSTAATPLSTSTKNRIMLMMNKKRYGSVLQTPSGPGSIVQQSPAVCLNPRPNIQDDVVSANLKTKTGTLRTGRTMQRTNATKHLPENIQVSVKDKTKSTMLILPLAKSPRKISPRHTKGVSPEQPPPPPPCTPHNEIQDFDTPDGKQHQLHESEKESQALRFTPMFQGIKELTLAALQEESPVQPANQPQEVAKNVAEDPAAMSVDEEPAVRVKLHPLKNDTPKNGIPKRTRSTRSSRAEARRCQSFNDAYRARPRRQGHIPRRQSDVTAPTLGRTRSKPLSSSVPLSPAISTRGRKTAQSLLVLNRSPTRCTLRRGRPNTTRVGLPRPSPAAKGQGMTHSPAPVPVPAPQAHEQEDITPTNITINKKGRVSKRSYTRPPLIIANETTADKKLEQKDNKIVKPPRSTLAVNSVTNSKQSPKKPKVATLAAEPECSQQQASHPSYVASKLKREASGAINFAAATENVSAIPVPTVTTPSGRKGRSFSMRSDMIRPSPNKANIPYLSLSRKLTSCYENAGNHNVNETELKSSNSTPKLMKRGSSVQELVKKFDNNDVITKPTFATLRRESKIGRLNPPNFNASVKKGVAGLGAGETKAVPPVKPPRLNVTENLNGIYGTAKMNKSVSTKQVAQFNPTTRSTTTTNVGKGSSQVLKTINLA